ncbi:hypothetical protein ACFLQ7_02390 [Actinomycetota bacterium]
MSGPIRIRGRFMIVVGLFAVLLVSCTSEPTGIAETSTTHVSSTLAEPTGDTDESQFAEVRPFLSEFLAAEGIPADVADCLIASVLESEQLPAAIWDAINANGDEPPSELFADIVTKDFVECGMLDHAADLAASEMGPALGISVDAAECLTQGIWGSEAMEKTFIDVVKAEISEQPVPPIEPALLDQMVTSYLESLWSCGVIEELSEDLALAMGVSGDTAICVITDLYASAAMRPVMEQTMLEGLAAPTTDVDALLEMSSSIYADNEGAVEAATVEAVSACATEQELETMGLAGLGQLPLRVGGYFLWASDFTTQLNSLSEGYGDRNWVFGFYGDDELRYRLVVSVTDGPSLQAIDLASLRDWIPAEGLFAIEGGFDMDWTDETSLTVEGETRLACSPGFVGDSSEVEIARGFYDDGGWDEAISFDWVSAMCFFDNPTHVGFIKSDARDSIDDLIAIAQGITLELAG